MTKIYIVNKIVDEKNCSTLAMCGFTTKIAAEEFIKAVEKRLLSYETYETDENGHMAFKHYISGNYIPRYSIQELDFI